MRGLFGGGVTGDGATSIEHVAPEVARLLAAAPVAALPELPEPLRGVELVLFDVDVDVEGEATVRLSRDLASAVPIGALAGRRPEALSALARLASALGALHAAGACHGEITGDAVRVAPDGTVALLWCPRRLPPGAILGARLRSGASAAITAYAAPEVALGQAATPASDAYGVAALIFEVVAGAAPLGQLDLRGAHSGPFARLAALVLRGLAASPEARPAVGELAEALTEAAAIARHPEDVATAAEVAAFAPSANGAQSMSGILAVVLTLGGLCVLTGALWLVTVTWVALGGSGRLLLLCALTAGIVAASVALHGRSYSRSGTALALIGLELVWVDGGYVLDLARTEGVGPWAALACLMTTVAFAIAGALDSAPFAIAAALHFPVFAGLLGAWLHTGQPTGPALFALGVAAIAASVAFVGHRWRGAKLGMPFAVHAGLAGIGSGYGGAVLLLEPDHRVFGTLWPYLVVAIAGAGATALRAPYAAPSAAVVALLLATVPTGAALAPDLSLAYLLVAVAIGLACVAVSLSSPRLLRDRGAQLGGVVVGLVGTASAPTTLFLGKCLGQNELDVLAGPSAIYLIVLAIASSALVALSLALGKRALDKGIYRLIELVALGAIFGAFTLAAVARGTDLFYPTAVFVIGTACLALGAMTRRAALVVLAAVTLLLQVCIQYFVRLSEVFPASILVLGFGLALLVAGVIYERSLKQLLPTLRSWD